MKNYLFSRLSLAIIAFVSTLSTCQGFAWFGSNQPQDLTDILKKSPDQLTEQEKEAVKNTFKHRISTFINGYKADARLSNGTQAAIGGAIMAGTTAYMMHHQYKKHLRELFPNMSEKKIEEIARNRFTKAGGGFGYKTGWEQSIVSKRRQQDAISLGVGAAASFAAIPITRAIEYLKNWWAPKNSLVDAISIAKQTGNGVDDLRLQLLRLLAENTSGRLPYISYAKPDQNENLLEYLSLVSPVMLDNIKCLVVGMRHASANELEKGLIQGIEPKLILSDRHQKDGHKLSQDPKGFSALLITTWEEIVKQFAPEWTKQLSIPVQPSAGVPAVQKPS